MRDTRPSTLRCLLDDDADAVRAARARRFRSLAVSISLQALFVTVLVVAPLLATGKLPLQPPVPVLVFRGEPGGYRSHVRTSDSSSPVNRSNTFTFQSEAVAPRPASRDSGPTNNDPPPLGYRGPGCEGCQRDGVMDPPINLSSTPRGPAPPMPEARPPQAAVRQRVGGDVQQAKQIHNVTPLYPPLCKQMHLQGEIVFRAVIARDGSVQELSYVSGPACFLQYTQNAVAQWRYSPTLLNGQPTEVETTIRVVFRMNQ